MNNQHSNSIIPIPTETAVFSDDGVIDDEKKWRWWFTFPDTWTTSNVGEKILGIRNIWLNQSRRKLQYTLKLHKYLKHKLIATQFIENPDDLDFVDHINRNRLDNRINNLRWCSSSENARNKTSHKRITYEYIDDISDDAVVVRDYGQHSFEDYFYVPDEDKFYFYNGSQYRRMYVNEDRNGLLFVCMRNTEGRSIRIYLSKFKKLYGFD